MDSTDLVIIGQKPQNTTNKCSQIVYTVDNLLSLYCDYDKVEAGQACGDFNTRTAGAYKANITRRISLEIWLLYVMKVDPAYVILWRDREPKLLRTPHKVAFRIDIAASKFGLNSPPPKVIEARLLRKPDPVRRKKATHVTRKQKLLTAPTTALTAPTKPSVSERQRAAAHKAWATRRARAQQQAA